jgi:hypothetical protein
VPLVPPKRRELDRSEFKTAKSVTNSPKPAIIGVEADPSGNTVRSTQRYYRYHKRYRRTETLKLIVLGTNVPNVKPLVT